MAIKVELMCPMCRVPLRWAMATDHIECRCGLRWSGQTAFAVRTGIAQLSIANSTVGEPPILGPQPYDGLTAGQCLERYVARQRGWSLLWMTASQLKVARSMWSQELREKCAESRPKLTIMVDQDIDE